MEGGGGGGLYIFLLSTAMCSCTFCGWGFCIYFCFQQLCVVALFVAGGSVYFSAFNCCL